MKMLSALTFTIGFAVGALAYRRARRRAEPHIPHGFTRHIFHVDLPAGEMPELAERPYYTPSQKRNRI